MQQTVKGGISLKIFFSLESILYHEENGWRTDAPRTPAPPGQTPPRTNAPLGHKPPRTSAPPSPDNFQNGYICVVV